MGARSTPIPPHPTFFPLETGEANKFNFFVGILFCSDLWLPCANRFFSLQAGSASQPYQYK
jgi:hypothetical protein